MNSAIATTRTELTNAFDRLFDVFAVREDVLYYQSLNGGWSIYQVLEHVVLANHFLLRIVNKQAEKTMQWLNRADNKNKLPYVLNTGKLKNMELNGSYIWVPQRYTEPEGATPLLELKISLHDQRKQAIELLENEKLLQAIEDSYVAGKIDALHYLYFLVQHMQRHLGQVTRLKQEFSQWQRQSLYNENIRLAKRFA
jgi:uncharacterized damage-inducible protein DinB